MKRKMLLFFIGFAMFFSMLNVEAKVIQADSLVTNGWFSIKSLDDTGVTVTDSYCSKPNFLKPFKLLGRIFSVVKIILPIIILAFGVVDFFKAVIASKDDEIKKATKSLIMRLIAGVCIFFLPAIIHFVFRLVDDWNDYDSDYSKCSLCITSPNQC
jgi:hypothetical protein